MNVATIIVMILQVVTQLIPLAEQLRLLATTTTVTPEDMTKIDVQLKVAHDRLGELLRMPILR